MTMQSVFDWILGAYIALLSAVAYDMNRRIEKNRDELSDHKERVAREYASKEETDKIDAKLDRILEKLDKKQDRAN